MNIFDLKQQVGLLLSEGEQRAAVTLLAKHARTLFPHLIDEIITIQGNLSTLENSQIRGTLTDKDQATQIEKIQEAILLLLSKIERQVSAPALRREGKLLYSIPGEMSVQVPSLCLVRLALTEILLREALPENLRDSVTQDIELGEIMSVDLLDEHPGKAFKIEKDLSAYQQNTKEDSYSEWRFHVTPLLEGRFPLKLKISIVKRIGKDEYFENEILTKDIHVVTHELTPLPVTFEDSSKRFVYYYSNSKAATGVVPVLPEKQIETGSGTSSAETNPETDAYSGTNNGNTVVKRSASVSTKILWAFAAIALSAVVMLLLRTIILRMNNAGQDAPPHGYVPPASDSLNYTFSFPLQSRQLLQVFMDDIPQDQAYVNQDSGYLNFKDSPSRTHHIKVVFSNKESCKTRIVTAVEPKIIAPYFDCSPFPQGTVIPPSKEPVQQIWYTINLLDPMGYPDNIRCFRPVVPKIVKLVVDNITADINGSSAGVKLPSGNIRQVTMHTDHGQVCAEDIYFGADPVINIPLCRLEPTEYNFYCVGADRNFIESITIDGLPPDRIQADQKGVRIWKKLVPVRDYVRIIVKFKNRPPCPVSNIDVNGSRMVYPCVIID
jgi:hypothetical protein